MTNSTKQTYPDGPTLASADDVSEHQPAVHWCDWAQQPDIRIACTETYTSPKWGSFADETGIDNVFLADTDDRYAFDRTLVTCGSCILKISHAEPECTDPRIIARCWLAESLFELVALMNAELRRLVPDCRFDRAQRRIAADLMQRAEIGGGS